MRLSRLSIIVLGLAISGCDDRPPSGPIPVHPVAGRVTYKGKPLPNVLVTFHSSAPIAKVPESPGSAGPIKPTGRTDADGNFKLHSYVGDDGAPVGDYRVTVALANVAETRNVMAKAAKTEIIVSLPPKYGDPATSGLTGTVHTGENTIDPFELK